MWNVENQDSLFLVHFIEIDLQAQKANARFYNWRQGPEPEFKSEKETLCSVSAVKQSTLSNLHTQKKTNKLNHNRSAKEHLTEISNSEKRRSYKQTATEVHTRGGGSKLS
jgi:hypothetical protein